MDHAVRFRRKDRLVEMPSISSREEWLAARMALRAREDAVAEQLERLNDERRRLPMVEITKPYLFTGPEGPVTLQDLFAGHRQLIVYHFMFDPTWDEGCRYCSFNMDNLGHLDHLLARDTSLVVISRAPLSKIAPFKARMGWTFPWVSSAGNDFNHDFHATLDGTVPAEQYVYKSADAVAADGEYLFTDGDQGGTTVFLRDGDRIFQTYAVFGGRLDVLNGLMNYLDLTPLGRQDVAIRHHDRYKNLA
jgi:predicted dithiol-disulfide oxidoreductase (DUF899 family)